MSRNSDAEPLLILTKSGVSYLQETWHLIVNKNGLNCAPRIMSTPVAGEVRKRIQKLDNRIFNIILPFYSRPEMVVKYTLHRHNQYWPGYKHQGLDFF